MTEPTEIEPLGGFYYAGCLTCKRVELVLAGQEPATCTHSGTGWREHGAEQMRPVRILLTEYVEEVDDDAAAAG